MNYIDPIRKAEAEAFSAAVAKLAGDAMLGHSAITALGQAALQIYLETWTKTGDGDLDSFVWEDEAPTTGKMLEILF